MPLSTERNYLLDKAPEQAPVLVGIVEICYMAAERGEISEDELDEIIGSLLADDPSLWGPTMAYIEPLLPGRGDVLKQGQLDTIISRLRGESPDRLYHLPLVDPSSMLEWELQESVELQVLLCLLTKPHLARKIQKGKTSELRQLAKNTRGRQAVMLMELLLLNSARSASTTVQGVPVTREVLAPFYSSTLNSTTTHRVRFEADFREIISRFLTEAGGNSFDDDPIATFNRLPTRANYEAWMEKVKTTEKILFLFSPENSHLTTHDLTELADLGGVPGEEAGNYIAMQCGFCDKEYPAAEITHRAWRTEGDIEGIAGYEIECPEGHQLWNEQTLRFWK